MTPQTQAVVVHLKVTPHRATDEWKVRWCGGCRQYEYDTGAPRGWVMLKGSPPEGVRLNQGRE